MARSWAKGINSFIKGIYNSIFGEKQKTQTQQEIEDRTGTKWIQMSQEERNAYNKKMEAEELARNRGKAGGAV